MKTKLIALAAFVTSIFASAQVLAHHSFAAEFDAAKQIKLHGTVIKLEWTNPHTYFMMEVEGPNGEVQEWALEMGSPNGLMRRGWTRDTLPVGTEIYVTGTQARDGSFKGNAQAVVIAENCQRLFAGTSQRDFVEDDSAPVDVEGCGL
ncbi:MAG: hypothetical protein LBE21_08290 [Pseudomonadales bacterium]|jgi:hypothetical protein|nr:hypothetical protein [Pseudomonadales bacterium]